MLIPIIILLLIVAGSQTILRRYDASMNTWIFLMIILYVFNIGNPDYHAYVYAYNNRVGAHEWLWNYLSIIAKDSGLDYILFRFILVTISFLLIRKTIVKYSFRPDIVCILYFIFPFALDVTQVRNFIAMSILVYAFPLLIYRKLFNRLCFILLTILAAGFHYAAYIYLPLAFLDLVFDRIKMKHILIMLCCLIGIAYIIVQKYIDDIIYTVIDNYGEMDTRIAGAVDNGKGSFGFLMYWMFYISGIIFLYWGSKTENPNSTKYKFIRILIYANIYLALYLPMMIFDSTFERLTRNLVLLIYIGLTIRSSHYPRSSYNIIGSPIKNILFVGYVTTMCYMDIVNGYYDTIVIPLFTKNLLSNNFM